MAQGAMDTDELLRQAAAGAPAAWEQLLAGNRPRLRRMVALRLDRRLSARLDPSDVVQEVLADAARQRDDYLKRRPLPFYPWLRQFAWERLVDVHRHHVSAMRRSVAREVPQELPLPDRSAIALIDRLLDGGTSPSGQMIREERRLALHAALDRLAAGDREILVMRYLEQLSSAEIAAVLGIREGAMKMRLLRATEKLRSLMAETDENGSPLTHRTQQQVRRTPT